MGTNSNFYTVKVVKYGFITVEAKHALEAIEVAEKHIGNIDEETVFDGQKVNVCDVDSHHLWELDDIDLDETIYTKDRIMSCKEYHEAIEMELDDMKEMSDEAMRDER